MFRVFIVKLYACLGSMFYFSAVLMLRLGKYRLVRLRKTSWFGLKIPVLVALNMAGNVQRSP